MIRAIRLRNWMCYRGEHELLLGPFAYALVAAWEDDPERSNTGGKSSLARAIPFAVYGHHQKRYEDEWIADGEPDGYVEVELSSGLTMKRSRTRGRPNKLEVSGASPATGDEAQSVILEEVGMSKKDFFWGAYVDQKAVSRFVVTEPSERMAIVGEWFRFNKLQEAETAAKARAAKASIECDRARTEIAKWTGSLSTAEGEFNPDLVEVAARQALVSAKEKVADAATALAIEEKKFAAAAEARASARDRRRYLDVVKEGQTLREAVDRSAPAVLAKDVERCTAARDAAAGRSRSVAANLNQAAKVTSGNFDGRCPVSERECPVAGEINSDREAAGRREEILRAQAKEAKEKLDLASSAYYDATSAMRSLDSKQERLELLRQEARRLKPTAKAAEEGPDVDEADLARLRQSLTDALVEERSAGLWNGQVDTAKARIRAEGEKLKAASAEVEASRLAAWAFGKGGAQREIARSNLAEMEKAANARLRASGIDLSLAVTWDREGKDLATSCDRCGRVYGKGKQRSCDSCGAARGKSVEHRLDVEVSPVSGAAEDLAGLAFQLSAAEWLRRRRSSGWDTLVVDEPFGSLDAANRRALQRHLAALLLSSTWRQSLVIAHHTAVTDSLPGRIEVSVSPSGGRKVSVSP